MFSFPFPVSWVMPEILLYTYFILFRLIPVYSQMGLFHTSWHWDSNRLLYMIYPPNYSWSSRVKLPSLTNSLARNRTLFQIFSTLGLSFENTTPFVRQHMIRSTKVLIFRSKPKSSNISASRSMYSSREKHLSHSFLNFFSPLGILCSQTLLARYMHIVWYLNIQGYFLSGCLLKQWKQRNIPMAYVLRLHRCLSEIYPMALEVSSWIEKWVSVLKGSDFEGVRCNCMGSFEI